jgi:hypothetical protein
LNEQTKTNGFAGKHDMIMNLVQAMLAGRVFDGETTKNKILKVELQTEHIPNQVYDYAIF